MPEAALEQIDQKGYDKPFLSGGRGNHRHRRLEGRAQLSPVSNLFPGRGDTGVIGKSGVYRAETACRVTRAAVSAISVVPKVWQSSGYAAAVTQLIAGTIKSFLEIRGHAGKAVRFGNAAGRVDKNTRAKLHTRARPECTVHIRELGIIGEQLVRKVCKIGSVKHTGDVFQILEIPEKAGRKRSRQTTVKIKEIR